MGEGQVLTQAAHFSHEVGMHGMNNRPGTKEEQVSGQKHDGVMIGSFLEKGTAPTGEAQVEVRDAVRSNLRMAESSLDKERIPAELREVAKKYIEKLNERVQGD